MSTTGSPTASGEVADSDEVKIVVPMDLPVDDMPDAALLNWFFRSIARSNFRLKDDGEELHRRFQDFAFAIRFFYNLSVKTDDKLVAAEEKNKRLYEQWRHMRDRVSNLCLATGSFRLMSWLADMFLFLPAIPRLRSCTCTCAQTCR